MRVASSARRIQGRGGVSILFDASLVMDVCTGCSSLNTPRAPTLTCVPDHPKMGP